MATNHFTLYQSHWLDALILVKLNTEEEGDGSNSQKLYTAHYDTQRGRPIGCR